MNNKKLLTDEELDKVVGGETYMGWYSEFYCEKCRKSYTITGDIETYTCPDCGAGLQRTIRRYYEPGRQHVEMQVHL